MLDSKTIDKIDKKAIALLERTFGSLDAVKFPLDLNKVVESCGLSVRQGEFAPDSDLEGALDRQKHTIYLSESDSYEGKNFTTAHELGHFKLHEEVETDLFTMHQLQGLLVRQGKNPREDEADQFAASLLMPEKALKSLWEVTHDTETLSKIFGVPEIAVRYRLAQLNFK
jgi:Zn-dependent peptidase ImmA (M78 family)